MISKFGKNLSKDNQVHTLIPTSLGALAGGAFGGASDYLENSANKRDYDFWKRMTDKHKISTILDKPRKVRYGLPLGIATGALLGYALPKAIKDNQK